MGYEDASFVLRSVGLRGGPLDLPAGSDDSRSGQPVPFVRPSVRQVVSLGVRFPLRAAPSPHAQIISFIDLLLRFDYQGLSRLTHSHLIDDYNS